MVGAVYGPSDWMAIDQGRVDRFAEATGDRQWIHIDPQRARRGALGGTIAHGNLTLALITPMFDSLVIVTPCEQVINYGYDKIRFLTPVRVGSSIRLSAELLNVEERPSALLCSWKFSVHVDYGSKPALVARKLQLFVPET
ncbi:hypothetical protein CH272_18620 [Rhodococcus sp. 05-340-1]|nr:hypothetical protein CH254_14180 [Rhodococcus sp. 06-412-2C]OZC96511.1 hypothetical protein CH279_14350 [Rhodococcus sp. 06-412-2B]OZD65455.1 hypothetical protein CH271_20170 [Rhodococcus sp. 05-340-2]OZD74678.1 hypothetical protein CH272_18620 [Rhodococcus sp. 05-340-1]OZD86743.1 hypothetical protein CH273_00405 [Rhodococcus sp. 05-339-2]